MLGLINAYRARNGLTALGAAPALTRAALFQSADMAANRYFAHDDPIRPWAQRLSDCGYPAAAAGENIAEGNADAASTFEQWRVSAPHNANLLGAGFRAVGIGRAQTANGDWYWTADFGDSLDSASAASAAPAAATVLTPPAVGPLAPPPSSVPLATGMIVAISAPGDCLRSRAGPSMTSAVQTCIADGTLALILAGPVTADGHTWWQLYGAGWVAGDFLRPASL